LQRRRGEPGEALQLGRIGAGPVIPAADSVRIERLSPDETREPRARLSSTFIESDTDVVS
jgi:hypothetical protein